MRKYLGAAALAAIFLFAGVSDAWALFQLTASPRRGGQTVRFESARPGGMLRNEEVTVAVITDRAASYRILQTVYQPLTNETGKTIPAGAFVMFSPSRPLGTLRTQLETVVGMGQQQIYTSNNGGDSDEFVLVYNVHVPDNQPGGVYRTQITFTAEPVNMQAGTSPSTTTLEVRVEIDPEFSVEVVGQGGARGLDFGKITKDRPFAVEPFEIAITSNAGTPYRIYQQITEPLVSVQGEALEAGAFTFAPSGQTQGTLAGGAGSPVPEAQTLLYTSNDFGGSDRIVLQYRLEPSASQKAGVYRGNLSFRVESPSSSSAAQQVLNVPIAVEIASILSLETQFDQGYGFNFGSFKTGEEEQRRRVTLKVRSNLGEPYQVSQIVPRKMTAVDGSTLPSESFRFFVTPPKTGTAQGGASAVKEGESVIFTSDRTGTPESFSVDYSLKVPPASKAGAYSSEIKYSITTL